MLASIFGLIGRGQITMQMGSSKRTNRCMWRVILLLTAVAMVAPCGAVTLKVDDPVLQDCPARALPQKDMKQSVSLKVFDATGSVSESQARVYWQYSAADKLRLLVRLHAPPMRAALPGWPLKESAKNRRSFSICRSFDKRDA